MIEGGASIGVTHWEEGGRKQSRSAGADSTSSWTWTWNKNIGCRKANGTKTRASDEYKYTDSVLGEYKYTKVTFKASRPKAEVGPDWNRNSPSSSAPNRKSSKNPRWAEGSTYFETVTALAGQARQNKYVKWTTRTADGVQKHHSKNMRIPTRDALRNLAAEEVEGTRCKFCKKKASPIHDGARLVGRNPARKSPRRTAKILIPLFLFQLDIYDRQLAESVPGLLNWLRDIENEHGKGLSSTFIEKVRRVELDRGRQSPDSEKFPTKASNYSRFEEGGRVGGEDATTAEVFDEEDIVGGGEGAGLRTFLTRILNQSHELRQKDPERRAKILQSIREEFENFRRHEVFEVVPIPSGTKVLNMFGIIAEKEDGRIKTRAVGNGSNQEAIASMFPALPRWTTIRVFSS